MNNILLARKRVCSAIAAASLLGLTLAGCSADEPAGAGERLPEGKYPITFTAAVDGLALTRATADGTWEGGESVAIKIGDVVKEYTVKVDKTLSIVDGGTPFFWTNRQMNVSAWCSSTYSDTRPTAFSVKDDQNGTGYQESDFLYVSQNITYPNVGGTAELTFKHLPAKVVVNLKYGDGVTGDEVANATVSIVNQTTASGEIAEDGTVAQVTSGSAAITPHTLTSAVSGYQKSVQALLVPQNMKNKPFIQVTIGTGTAAACDYYYTPAGDKDANLTAGKQYTYNITVKKDKLEVEAGTSVSWSETPVAVSPNDNFAYQITAPATGVTIAAAASGGTLSGNNGSYTLSDGNEITVTVNGRSDKFLKGLSAEGIYDRSVDYKSGTYTYTYKLKSDILLSEPVFVDTTEPEVGYFYYFDGTWSADLWDKPCVGIVFKVGVGEDDNINNYSGSGLTGEINGYAVALNTLTGSRQGWGSISSVTINTDNEKFYGYRNTQTIKSASGYGESDFWACYHAANHTPAAPANSSGWYLPSLGEYNVLWQVYGSIQSLFASAGGTDMKISWGLYWTSSTTSSSAACVDFGAWNATKSFTDAIRTEDAYVRPVLTF